jgi:NADH:ubiquinone oxidoreductase subunit 3 (subunit A)
MTVMDKYLLVVMIFLITGIPIAFINPVTGTPREHPIILLFYASIGGISVIILYSSYKDRKQKQKDNLKRRSKK